MNGAPGPWGYPLPPGGDLAGNLFGWFGLRRDGMAKIFYPLELLLRSSFFRGLAEEGAGGLESVEHFAGLFGVNAIGGEAGDDHGEGLLDGVGVAQGVEDVGAEAGAGVERGSAGAAELLVIVAEGAGGEGGRLAAAAVGLGVAAERVVGGWGSHGVPFGLNEKSRT